MINFILKLYGPLSTPFTWKQIICMIKNADGGYNKTTKRKKFCQGGKHLI